MDYIRRDFHSLDQDSASSSSSLLSYFWSEEILIPQLIYFSHDFFVQPVVSFSGWRRLFVSQYYEKVKSERNCLRQQGILVNLRHFMLPVMMLWHNNPNCNKRQSRSRRRNKNGRETHPWDKKLLRRKCVTKKRCGFWVWEPIEKETPDSWSFITLTLNDTFKSDVRLSMKCIQCTVSSHVKLVKNVDQGVLLRSCGQTAWESRGRWSTAYSSWIQGSMNREPSSNRTDGL